MSAAAAEAAGQMLGGAAALEPTVTTEPLVPLSPTVPIVPIAPLLPVVPVLSVVPTFNVTLLPTGRQFAALADMTLLQAAELEAPNGARFLIDSSCRNGTCRTCLSRLVEGEVRYRIKWPGLSEEEKSGGYVLPCVAYPLSAVVLRVAS